MSRWALRGVVTAVVAAAGLFTTTNFCVAGTHPPPLDSRQGTVDPSRVDVGGSTTFAAGGFTAGAALEIADDGARLRSINADAAGNFSTTVFFNGAARPGIHVLSATGVGAHHEKRTVTAVVEVLGEQVSSRSVAADRPFADSRSSSRLMFTGLDAVALVAAVVVLLVVGSLVVLETERRYRRRMRRVRPT
ncbi:MAG TPA: hypothetical protein VFH54_04495 [Mycobacteriales bacterium]|nr:hypothetical protein [Mycobacteriales bacterium]